MTAVALTLALLVAASPTLWLLWNLSQIKRGLRRQIDGLDDLRRHLDEIPTNDASRTLLHGSEGTHSAKSGISAYTVAWQSGRVLPPSNPLRTLAIIAALLTFASGICGCGPPAPTENSQVLFEHGGLWVREIEVDGSEYIIATVPHGVAICPKTKPAEVSP